MLNRLCCQSYLLRIGIAHAATLDKISDLVNCNGFLKLEVSAGSLAQPLQPI